MRTDELSLEAEKGKLKVESFRLKFPQLTNDVTLHLVHLLRRLRNDRDLIVDPQRFQQRVSATARRTGSRCRALVLVVFLGDGAVSGVDVILEELVHAKGGGADGALVGEMGGLECHVVVARHVIEKLPLENLQS